MATLEDVFTAFPNCPSSEVGAAWVELNRKGKTVQACSNCGTIKKPGVTVKNRGACIHCGFKHFFSTTD
jgi:hypothetical protein